MKKMLLIVCLMLCAFSAHAQSLWGKTTFGMSMEEVRNAYPEAKEDPSPESLKSGAKSLLTMSGIEIAGRDYTADFYFDQSSQLQQVMLMPTVKLTAAEGKAAIDMLKEGLNSKYGQPSSTTGSPGGLASIQSWTWMSGKSNITLTYIQIGRNEPTVTLVYQVRLAKMAENL